ncbi:LOW QUALITY PROTEIN: protein FAM83C [Lampris incognitus]|uniref:LOW QUALITY PROTEIN: protein FAM83C n=1 Tax=Lampris incognitus TaxID=2546036 RepID=UPI0024B4D0C2|nr:LOW QUALITY PROTEIN: protein FAM83C [Lampris incognitus]
MDVSSLLGRMEQLYMEVRSMKHALQRHANVSKDLQFITEKINHQVCALECATDLTGGNGPDTSVAVIGATVMGTMDGATGLVGLASGAAPVEVSGLGAEEGATAGVSALEVEKAECDLMEASNKRRVPVYILLDEKNLTYFTDMCSALDVQNSHLSNMRIRSVCGDTYCTKSGKKFTGQVKEKFMIIDCEEVIAGSYSFTWLSAQVHSNMVMHFSGRITDSFDREFRCLYADSQIIDCFYNPEDEGPPYYSSYPVVTAPALTMGLGLPGMGLNVFSDRQRERERVCSENSSSQSSSSMSSVKAAPGMTPNTVYKVTHGNEKKEPNNNSHLSPERRGGGERERGGGQTPTPQNQTPPGTHVTLNGGTDLSPVSPFGQSIGIEWPKSNPADFLRANVGGTTSKFQGLGLYNSKPNVFHNAGTNPSTPSTYQTTKTQSPTPEDKLTPKQRTTSSPFLNKLTDLFLPPSSKDKDSNTYRKSPPQTTLPWSGPDLSQTEPESQQSPPPPTSPVVLMNRQDQKRMTLGHSKLDLVNHYNKMKSKQVYSRFELKSGN